MSNWVYQLCFQIGPIELKTCTLSNLLFCSQRYCVLKVHHSELKITLRDTRVRTYTHTHNHTNTVDIMKNLSPSTKTVDLTAKFPYSPLEVLYEELSDS